MPITTRPRARATRCPPRSSIKSRSACSSCANQIFQFAIIQAEKLLPRQRLLGGLDSQPAGEMGDPPPHHVRGFRPLQFLIHSGRDHTRSYRIGKSVSC